MTRTFPQIAAPALRLHLQDSETKLVRTVLGSERLLRVLPTDERDQLFRAHAAAEAAAAARLLPRENTADLEAEIDAAHRASTPVDPAELLARVGAAEAARTHRDVTVRLLESFPGKYAQDIIRLVVRHEEDYYEALNDDLNVLLDDTEPVAAALAGVNTADEAIDAGLGAEWAQIRSLARDFAAIRSEQGALIAHHDNSTNYAAGSAGLLRAWFGGIESVFPNYVAETLKPAKDMLGNPLPGAHFPLFDTASPLHILAVSRLRARIQPRVIHPDEIGVVLGPIDAGIARPSTLTPEQTAYMYARARRAAAERMADERAGLL